MSRILWSALFGMLLAAVGCMGPIQVEPVATSVQRPSNIAVYLSVKRDKQPLTGLTLQNFRIYEDGQLLSHADTQLKLLSRDVAVDHHTLLLVDLTAANSDVDRRVLAQAAARFVRSVRRTQPVALYAFDGSAEIRKVEEYPRETAPGESVLVEPLERQGIADRSRNLHGAVLQGLSQLDRLLAAGTKPVRVGTLVVLTAGPDVAGRVGWEQVDAALDRTRHQVFAVAIGNAFASDMELGNIGRAGIARSKDLPTLGPTLDKAAKLVEDAHASHYLLSYCSPSRGGIRKLSIEVEIAGPNGNPLVGQSETEFSAEGFAPGCNSDDPPRFVVTVLSANGVPGVAPETVEPEPPKPEEKTDQEKADEEKKDGEEGEAKEDEKVEEEEPKPKPKPKPRWRPRPRPAAPAKPAEPAKPKPAEPAKPAKPAEPAKPPPSPPGEPPDFSP